MTRTERQERNEAILRGERPGPTKMQERWNAVWPHLRRWCKGIGVLSAVSAVFAGAGFAMVAFGPAVLLVPLGVALISVAAYGIGTVIENW